MFLGKEAKGKGGAKGGAKGGKAKKGKGDKEDAVLPVIPVSLAHTHYRDNMQRHAQVTRILLDYIVTGSSHSATPTPGKIAHTS